MENIVTKSELLPIRVGIDVGSTTVKVAILDDNDKILYGDYQRHRADIRSTIITVVNKALDFLEKEVTLNPQTLADKLLNYALEQYGGVAKDDMTAIVVKVYSK